MKILILTVREEKQQEEFAFGGFNSLSKFLKEEYNLDNDEIDYLGMEDQYSRENSTIKREFELRSMPFTAKLPIDL
jgi:hypothetical protein